MARLCLFCVRREGLGVSGSWEGIGRVPSAPRAPSGRHRRVSRAHLSDASTCGRFWSNRRPGLELSEDIRLSFPEPDISCFFWGLAGMSNIEGVPDPSSAMVTPVLARHVSREQDHSG